VAGPIKNLRGKCIVGNWEMYCRQLGNVLEVTRKRQIRVKWQFDKADSENVGRSAKTRNITKIEEKWGLTYGTRAK